MSNVYDELNQGNKKDVKVEGGGGGIKGNRYLFLF